MKDAVRIAGERWDESRRDDVMLANRIAVGDQRRREGAHDDDEQNEKPKCPAPVPQQPRHVAFPRTRGSTHAASTSAIMLPATTRTALIAVAAITTG